MDEYTAPPVIAADDFARRFSLRAANLMWLLGAGASASAGIPTASDMVWDFKQRLFVSQCGASPQAVADLSSSSIRARLQAYIDSAGNFPPSGDPDEYATLFEAVYPAESDRRAYIEGKIAGAKPSYGTSGTRHLYARGTDPSCVDHEFRFAHRRRLRQGSTTRPVL